MATNNSDFVDVQLSADGIAAVGGAKGSLGIRRMHMNYTFTPGTPVRVLTSEWAKTLSMAQIKGKSIFELAPATIPGAAAGTTASAQLKKLKADEATLAAQAAKEGSK